MSDDITGSGNQQAAPDAVEPSDAAQHPSGRRQRLKLAVPLVLVICVLGAVTAILAGSPNTKLPANATSTKSSAFAGAVATPPKPAPPLELSNYDGRPVDLRQYAGKAVFVTFLYTHCPDVCPLIASNLGVAATELAGQLSKVRMVAVSVDPHGDTPSSVASFLQARGLNGLMDYLIGSPQQLGAVWAGWNVGSQSDASNPEFVAHSALVYGISASGKVTTLYPANFQPGEIVHDVPRLLAQ